MKNISFLVSGNGGTLKFLTNACSFISDARKNFRVNAVISDRKCGAIDFALDQGIYSKQIKYRRDSTEQLKEILKETNPDFIITNIHKILDEETVMNYEGKLIN